MGLDRLHTLTSYRAFGMRMDMTGWDGKTFWAEYDKFNVGPESGNYKLNVGDYATDSIINDVMFYHNGMMFTIYLFIIYLLSFI